MLNQSCLGEERRDVKRWKREGRRERITEEDEERGEIKSGTH